MFKLLACTSTTTNLWKRLSSKRPLSQLQRLPLRLKMLTAILEVMPVTTMMIVIQIADPTLTKMTTRKKMMTRRTTRKLTAPAPPRRQRKTKKLRQPLRRIRPRKKVRPPRPKPQLLKLKHQPVRLQQKPLNRRQQLNLKQRKLPKQLPRLSRTLLAKRLLLRLQR